LRQRADGLAAYPGVGILHHLHELGHHGGVPDLGDGTHRQHADVGVGMPQHRAQSRSRGHTQPTEDDGGRLAQLGNRPLQHVHGFRHRSLAEPHEGVDDGVSGLIAGLVPEAHNELGHHAAAQHDRALDRLGAYLRLGIGQGVYEGDDHLLAADGTQGAEGGDPGRQAALLRGAEQTAQGGFPNAREGLNDALPHSAVGLHESGQQRLDRGLPQLPECADGGPRDGGVCVIQRAQQVRRGANPGETP